MNIKNIKIDGYVALAPMASVADKAFREICADFGAAYVVSEMVSSNGILYGNKKTGLLLENSKKEKVPFAVQIFGNDPQIMAYAAKLAICQNPDIIDINMGCPAPKIIKNGYGAALMKDPKLCGKIVNAVKNAVSIPVTVKIRKGWDKNNINAVEVAKICEYNGADALAIHGRTKEQMYALDADLEIIKNVKKELTIPVIGNGDVVDEESAENMIKKTGCNLIMIGRGALGKPWIFNNINNYLKTGKKDVAFDVKNRMDIMLKHIKLICDEKGEKIGMAEARKHVAYYIKGLKDACTFRKEAFSLKTFDELKRLSEKVCDKNL